MSVLCHVTQRLVNSEAGVKREVFLREPLTETSHSVHEKHQPFRSPVFGCVGCSGAQSELPLFLLSHTCGYLDGKVLSNPRSVRAIKR